MSAIVNPSKLRICVTPSGCWLWTGGLNKGRGYAQVRLGGRRWRAHRLAYALFHGPLGKKVVCHTCDTPHCVSPLHLFGGTQADNMQDASRKGRLRRT